MTSIDLNGQGPLDFDTLKREGIRHIQRLTGARWTDYNTHDPGITLLEVLCYALTDLSYRTGYSVPDLLGGAQAQQLLTRYGPAQMLPGAPLSMADLRRILLDAENTVVNARVEAAGTVQPPLFFYPSEGGGGDIGMSAAEGAVELSISGLYKGYTAGGAPSIAAAALSACRPLCGDWVSVESMLPETITIKADVEILPEAAQPKLVAEQVIRMLRAAITPLPRFQDRAGLLRNGVPADRVFEGPLLQQGYLDPADTDSPDRRDFLRASDLIQVLMDVPGVSAVRSISMGANGRTERWLLPLTPGKYPQLASDSAITLYRGVLREIFKASDFQELSSGALPASATPEPPVKPDRNPGRYDSIRRQLPALYRLHYQPLPEEKPVDRAHARQMGAYLLFFEQLLADYFAQLAHVRRLFNPEDATMDTYAVQVLMEVPGALELFGLSPGLDRPVFAEELSHYLQSGAEAPNGGRIQRLLNHLMARFAENFTDYALLVSGRTDLTAQLPDVKRAFLRDYPALGLLRGTGTDLTKPHARSGLEHRIARLLGLPWPPASTVGELSEQVAAGDVFFLVEHLLLRPVPRDAADKEEGEYWLTNATRPDPYSRQMTYVFPAYSSRFPQAGAFEAYQDYVRITLHRETPAHLIAHDIWLEPSAMAQFADAYQSWRTALADASNIDNNAYRVARDRVIDLLQVPSDTPDAPPAFLIGWSKPILDLDLSVPLVSPQTRVPLVIRNSQRGVVYTLYNRLGDKPVLVGNEGRMVPTGGTPIVVNGDGKDLDLLLPKLEKDTNFLIRAQKQLLGQSTSASGFLRQKVRVRVGIDVNIPAEILTPEINFATAAQIRLTRSQAEVDYVLVNAQTPQQDQGLPSSTEGDGQAIVLISNNLGEDIVFNIRASRTIGNNTDRQLLTGVYPIRVRPSATVPVVEAVTVVVDYNQPASIRATQVQASARYALYARGIQDTEFLHNPNPASWTAASLSAALVPLGQTVGFVSQGQAVPGNVNGIVLTSLPLQENARFMITAGKTGHNQGVMLTKNVAVLVRPNAAVQATVANSPIAPGTTAVIRIIDPQAGVLYSLRKRGETNLLASVYYHSALAGDPTEDSIERSRIEFDFFVGEPFAPPLTLETPPLSVDTVFEIVAEKVVTGLTVILTAALSVTIQTPPPPAAPRGTKTPRNPGPPPISGAETAAAKTKSPKARQKSLTPEETTASPERQGPPTPEIVKKPKHTKKSKKSAPDTSAADTTVDEAPEMPEIPLPKKKRRPKKE